LKKPRRSTACVTEPLAFHGMPATKASICELAKKSASKDEIITALENIIQELRNS